MRRFLRRLVDVHREELPQFSVLSIVYFIFIVGLVWSENAIRAELVDIIAYDDVTLYKAAQFYGSIFVVVASVIYTAYVDRIPKNRMVMILLILGVTAIGSITAALFILGDSFQAIGYFLLFLWHRFFFYIWVVHWFTYIIDLYDTQAAKRIFPLLSAARPIGTMLAGLSFSLITINLGVGHNTVMVIWVAIVVAVTAIFGLMPFILETQGVEDSLGRRSTTVSNTQASGLKSLGEGFRYVMSSSFLRWMAISALVLIAINTIIDVEVSTLIKGFDFINTTEDFSAFTARIDGITNIFVLIFQITLFNAILSRIGLGNMNLIYPVLVLGVSISLVIEPMITLDFIPVLIASFGYANYRGVRRVIRDPVFALLNNAVPVHAKGRARSVINAILSPTGGIIAGALLTSGLPENILFVILILSCIIYLISAFVLRLEYTRAMVQMLQQQSFTFLLAQRNEIGVTDSATMQILAENIKSSDDPEFKAFMASIIAEIGGRDALPILIDMINDAEDDYRRDLVEVVYHTDIRTDEMRSLYEELLRDANPRIREYAITGLGRVIGHDSLDYLTIIQPLLGDDELDVKQATIIALITANQEPYKSQAEQYLELLLNDENPVYRFVGLEILGKLDDVHRIKEIIPYLDDINDEVRLQATESVLSLWKDDVPREIYNLILERVESFMDDRVERVRMAELSLLSKIKMADSISALIRALEDPSPRIRQVAVTSLTKLGTSVIQSLKDIANTNDGLQSKMATITLCQIDRDDYGTLLDPYINQNLDRIYLNYKRLYALETCTEYTSVNILENAVSHELSTQLDDTFDLIAYRYGVESLDLIKEALRSADGRTRSNAVEALESVTTPQLARRVSPMLNPDMTTRVLAHINEDTQLDTFQVLLDIARGDDEWLRAVTLYAFGEIGRDHPDVSRIWSDLGRESDELTVTIDPCQRILKMDAVAVALRFSSQKDSMMVRLAAKAALRHVRGESVLEYAKESLEDSVLSIVERMIFLKKVSFFQGVAVEQLKVLASICDEELFNANDVVFREGVRGDSLYIVVSGLVSIGIFSKTSDNFTELAVYRPNSAFGEMSLFDYSPRSASAIAKTDVLLLKLRSEPLLSLMYQEPDLSIELLRSMSDNLRNANSRIASLTSTMRKSF